MERLDDALKERLRLCAYCPNVCRRGLPNDDAAAASEAATPSALAYLAFAVSEGWIDWDADVLATLSYLECVQAWVQYCQYDMDMVADLKAATAMISTGAG